MQSDFLCPEPSPSKDAAQSGKEASKPVPVLHPSPLVVGFLVQCGPKWRKVQDDGSRSLCFFLRSAAVPTDNIFLGRLMKLAVCFLQRE